MKICSICKKEKDYSDFNKNKTKPDGLNTVCKICSRKRSRQYYAENRMSHKKVVGERKKSVIQSNKEYIKSYLHNKICVDCGFDDWRVLEFDHLPSEIKTANVSTMVRNGSSLNTIKREIAKCDVVCANCHRIRTYSRIDCFRSE